MKSAVSSSFTSSYPENVMMEDVPEQYFFSFCYSSNSWSLVPCVPAYQNVEQFPQVPGDINFLRNKTPTNKNSLLEKKGNTSCFSPTINNTNVSCNFMVTEEMENFDRELLGLRRNKRKEERVPMYVKLNLKCFPPEHIQSFISSRNPVLRASLLCFYFEFGAYSTPKGFEIINKYLYHIYMSFFLLSAKSKLTKCYLSREKTLKSRWFNTETTRFKGGRLLRIKIKREKRREVKEVWNEMLNVCQKYSKADVPRVDELDEEYFFKNITKVRIEKRERQLRELAPEDDEEFSDS